MPLPRKLVLKQTVALLKIGISEADIERSIGWIEAHLPPNADAANWIPSAQDLQDDLISDAALVDSRMAFYGNKSIPKRLRRILDARAVE